MDSAEIRRKVRCSACNGSLSGMLNIIMLERKATWDYPTAGNVLTGETGQAVALCCDRCIEDRRPILEAVEFRGDVPVYHALDTLEKIDAPRAFFGFQEKQTDGR